MFRALFEDFTVVVMRSALPKFRMKRYRVTNCRNSVLSYFLCFLFCNKARLERLRIRSFRAPCQLRVPAIIFTFSTGEFWKILSWISCRLRFIGWNRFSCVSWTITLVVKVFVFTALIVVLRNQRCSWSNGSWSILILSAIWDCWVFCWYNSWFLIARNVCSSVI